jgi:hypothetical protein
MCLQNESRNPDLVMHRNGLLEAPGVVGDDLYTAVFRSLIYLSECYDEDMCEVHKSNLKNQVELHVWLSLLN